jgi:hypothetical protein
MLGAMRSLAFINSVDGGVLVNGGCVSDRILLLFIEK